MKKSEASSRWRHLSAVWRDTLILFREFRTPLIFFFVLIIGCGWIYYELARLAGEPINSTVESIYMILNMTFLQSSGNFPNTWYLQVFHFVMPVLGIGILADGLTDFGILLFNRRGRRKEWEMAVASTFTDHLVLVGLGHLGYRVAKNLHDMDEDVVIIELDIPSKTDLVASVRQMGIPVIEDDATRDSALQAAGIRQARGILLCTQNDSLNLQIAVKARSVNPGIQVIVRIFDDDFAASLQKQFGFRALSATGMAAPIFAANATNVDITAPLMIEDQPHSLARLEIRLGSRLVGYTIGQLENAYTLSVVFFKNQGQPLYHPSDKLLIAHDDILVVLGHPENINRFIHDAQK
jgi:voltage-gated potassium channel